MGAEIAVAFGREFLGAEKFEFSAQKRFGADFPVVCDQEFLVPKRLSFRPKNNLVPKPTGLNLDKHRQCKEY